MDTMGRRFAVLFVGSILLSSVFACHKVPATAGTPGNFSPTDRMTTPRTSHVATLLPNG
jgi:hypothetical protein